MPQPQHYYEFHTSILLANKNLYQEAAYIFYEENVFVLVSTNDEPGLTYKGLLLGFIEHCGVPVWVGKSQANEFPHHNMKLYIGDRIKEDTRLPNFYNASADQEQKPRTEFIIAGDDLELLCKSYMKACLYITSSVYENYLQTSLIRLEVLEGKSQAFFATLRAGHKPATYERKLLEPFSRLHSHASVHINGAISAEYKSEISSEIMKPPQIADDLLRSMIIAQYQAEEQFHHGNLDLACKTYQAVIEDVEIGFEWPPKSGRAFRCHDERTRCDNAICLAELNARNRLSEICLALHRPDQVRKWANGALAMISLHKNVTDADMVILQAKLHYHRAWASHQMAVRCRALDEIRFARRLDAGNVIYWRTQRDWMQEEAQQPHKHGKTFPGACKTSSA